MAASHIINSSYRWSEPGRYQTAHQGMPRVCIVTDSTAQFSSSHFPGKELIQVVPFVLEKETKNGMKSFLDQPELHLQHPAVEDFEHLFRGISKEYDSVLVLTLSSGLFPLAPRALSAAARFHNHLEIEVLDTRTTSMAMGWLAELAAKAATEGKSCSAIARYVRDSISGIYFLLFVSSPEGLVNTRHITPTQAMVAGMLNLLPIFLLDDGRLAPQEKAGSMRAAMEYFEEFMDEFENPTRLALIRGTAQPASRLGQLRQHIQSAHPGTSYSEDIFPVELDHLLGNESIGMAIMQKENHEDWIGF